MEIFGVPFAVWIVGGIIAGLLLTLMLLFLFGDNTPHLEAKFPHQQGLADAALRAMRLDFWENVGKTWGRARAAAEASGNSGLVGSFFVTVVVVIVFAIGVGAYRFFVPAQPDVVRVSDTCIRANGVGAWDLLKEGENILPGDSCNGKIVEATPTPTQIPTQAPTQTPLPVMVFTPGVVEILPSATPLVAKEDNYPILTVKSGGISGVIGSWSNISASALSASQPVESKTCDLVGFGEKTKPQFIVPSWAQSAYLVFYEPNSLWEVTNTQLSISGDTITITLCKEDVVFELFAY